MAPDPRLIERSGDIKQDLVAFAQGPRFQGEFKRLLRQRFGPRPALTEETAANIVDGFILEHRLQDGSTVLERFVTARPDLSEAERAMVLGWREVVRGPFLVDDRLSDTLIATNLVDELPYRIHSNMGGAALKPMKKGSYIIGRIVPVEDEWLLSGVHSLFAKSDRFEMESMAAALAEEYPEAAYRNPAKLEAAWAEQRRDYQEFVDFFGSDTVVVPGRELSSRLEAYVRHKLMGPAEGIDELGEPAIGEIVGGLGPMPESLLPKDLRTAETVGILYDPTDGLWFVKDYGRVLDAFADPGRLQERRNRRAVHALLTSEDYPPFVIGRPAERNPEKASRVFQQVLDQPEFSWARDGEALLRRSKPEFYTSPPLPGEASLIDDLMALATLSAALQLPLPPLALPSPGLSLFEEPLALPPLLEEEYDRPLVHVVHSVGRNDPCPCGSGRKYKRCCGA